MTTTPWPKAIGFLQSSALPMDSSASVRCVVCTVSWAPWLWFTGVHALCVVVYVRRPGHPGSCSPVRPLAVCSSHASYPPPHPRLFLCMLSLTALLLFPVALSLSSWFLWRSHSSLRLC